MKKTRIIALTLVLALVLMGAGYAYWSETLAVNTTIKTGEMDVVFEPCNIDYEDYDNGTPGTGNGPFDDDSRDYVKVGVTPADNNHKLNFRVEDLYPGSGGWMKFKIRNTGDVPVKLSSLTKELISDNGGLKDKLVYTVDEIKYYYYTPLGEIQHVPYFSDEITSTTLDGFVSKLENVLKYDQRLLTYGQPMVLEPSCWFEIVATREGYNIAMPKTITDQNLEGQTLEFNLKLNYTQCE